MEEAIQKADVLIEALGWIRRFRDKVTVIKLGGSLMDNEHALNHLLIDVVFMETVGMRPIIVHGGGVAISRAMESAGLAPRWVQGRRYTDDATLKIVEEVLGYQINEEIAAKIENLCYAGQVPVIPSMAIDERTGQKLNVNADTAATAVAQAVGAEKLMYLSDVNGVRRDKNDPSTLINSLTDKEARALIADGTIDSGMIPKVEACLETIDRGVRKVHIVDGRIRHSLLLEIYTNKGVGTELVRSES